MNNNRQPSRHTTLLILWLGLTGSPVTLWITLFIMDHFSLIKPVGFEFADYLFYAGIALFPAGIFMLGKYREANQEYLNAVTSATDDIADGFNRFQVTMLIGMSLADTPGMIGIAYYTLTGDSDKSALLISGSFLLCYFFKPKLPRERILE